MRFVNLAHTFSWLIAPLVGAGLGAALGYFGQCSSGTCPLTSTWWRGALFGALFGILFSASGPRARSGSTDQLPNDGPAAETRPPNGESK